VAGFEGFPADFFDFFAELELNNERAWFQANKPRYQAAVVEPMSAFIEAIAPELHRISKHCTADPRPHGGSMFRIHRDTRFSKDKSPYKTHAACQFRHSAGKDAHAPGFYAHFAGDGLFFGGGIWRPPNNHLALIREAIADNPAAWERLKSAQPVTERGGIQGDGLQRAPRGFDPEHRHVQDLKRKSFFVMTEAEPALLLRPELVATVAGAFRAAAPLNRFVSEALGLPF